ncbi:MAG: hypothetical protein ABW063_06890 [Caulobacter sp.]
MDRRSLILLGALALTGCATTRQIMPVASISSADIVFQALEPLHAASSGPGGLSIRIASSGCTTKADIVFHVEMRNGGAYIAFARRKIDGCKERGGEVVVSYSNEELGLRSGTSIFLLNPVARP